MDTLVKTYKTRSSMEEGVRAMARRGCSVTGQSGEFAANMWTTSLLNRPKVTVTFVQQSGPPAPRLASSAMDEDAAIALLTKLGCTVRPPEQTK